MSNRDLKLINELLILRGKIYDSEGESKDFDVLSRTIERLKETAKEGDTREPVHSA